MQECRHFADQNALICYYLPTRTRAYALLYLRARAYARKTARLPAGSHMKSRSSFIFQGRAAIVKNLFADVLPI